MQKKSEKKIESEARKNNPQKKEKNIEAFDTKSIEEYKNKTKNQSLMKGLDKVEKSQKMSEKRIPQKIDKF